MVGIYLCLYTNLLKDTVLDIWAEDVPQLSGDGKRVDAVDAVVTYGDGKYAVAAINKDRNEANVLELSNLEGSFSRMRIHTVNGPDADSYNDIGRTEVGVTVSEWMDFTGSVTLAPHSVNVIEIE